MSFDNKFALLVVGLPIAGLFYCGLIITLMLTVPTVREHPLMAGTLFFLVPFAIAAWTWTRASAKAYRQ